MNITRSARRAGISVLGMFMLFAALLPAARAQIVPVSLTKTSVRIHEFPPGPCSTPLPRKRAAQGDKDRAAEIISSCSARECTPQPASTCSDPKPCCRTSTRGTLSRGHSLRLPTPAYYASAALFATGMNFLGWKMARSARWHKIWWVPQLATMAGNMAGYGYTRAHPSPR